MANGAGMQMAESRLSSKLAPYGFDPAIIAAIIAAILPMILQCFNPTPHALKRKLGRRVRIVMGLRQQPQLAQLSWTHLYAIADAVGELVDAAEDTDLQAFLDDCKD